LLNKNDKSRTCSWGCIAGIFAYAFTVAILVIIAFNIIADRRAP
jgi:hypothetical protein